MDNKTKVESVNINVKDTFVGSAYSQLISVSVTDTDLMLEFVFVNPRTVTEGQVVSRVIMPRGVGEELAKTIEETIKKHEATKGGE